MGNHLNPFNSREKASFKISEMVLPVFMLAWKTGTYGSMHVAPVIVKLNAANSWSLPEGHVEADVLGDGLGGRAGCQGMKSKRSLLL
jgi:hypothetical protein